MRVRWLRKALRNLDEEATYIASDDPAAARLVVARVPDAVAMVAQQQGVGVPGGCRARASCSSSKLATLYRTASA